MEIKKIDLKEVARYYGMSWFQFYSQSNKSIKEMVERYKKNKIMEKEQLYIEIMRAIELIEEGCPNMAKEILLSLTNEITFINKIS